MNWSFISVSSSLVIVFIAIVVGIYIASDGDGNIFNGEQQETAIARWSENKTFLITGGNSGLGYGTALHLARAGTACRIILACRSKTKCQQAKNDLLHNVSTNNNSKTQIIALTMDLAHLDSVSQMVDELILLLNDNSNNNSNDTTTSKNSTTPTTLASSRKVTLILNAGVMGPTPHTTYNRDTNVETQMHVNHLGHVWLTHLLLLKGRDIISIDRIAVVSSLVGLWLGPFSDVTKDWYLRPPYHIKPPSTNFIWNLYNGVLQYSRSKLANLLFVMEFNSRFSSNADSDNNNNNNNKANNIITPIAFASHPGYTISNIMWSGFHWFPTTFVQSILSNFTIMGMSIERGALSQLRAALDPELDAGALVGPRWLVNGRPQLVGTAQRSWHHSWPCNTDEAKILWNKSMDALGIEEFGKQ